MNATRRDVLALLCTTTPLIAGCSSHPIKNYFPRTPSVEVEAKPLPNSLDALFDFNAEVTQEFSRDQPGRIRLQLGYNNSSGENSSVALQFGPTPPFSMYIGGKQQDEVGPPTIFAVPTTTATLNPVAGMQEPEQWIPESPNDGCWQQRTMPEPYPETADEPTSTQLEPGDELSEEYAVLGFGRESDCLPGGEYWFESGEPYQVDDDEREWASERDGLSFSIHID